MIRKLLCGTAFAAVLAAAPALAADMSYPVKAPPPVMVVPVFSWTGFYLGASAGYGWSGVDGAAPYSDPLFSSLTDSYSTGDLDGDGWFGGFQAGYNYQFYNNVVLGIEADVFFSDIKSDTYRFGYTAVDGQDTVDVYGSYQAKIDSFGTIRARLGYAFDRFLPYVTGGLAWANAKVSGTTVIDFTNNNNNDTVVGSGSYSDTYWGWALGVGAEYAITDNWTVKAEYIYADLGSTSFNGLFNNRDLDWDLQTLKVGVNYKF